LNIEDAGAGGAQHLLEQLEALLAAYPGTHPVVFELTRPSDFRARLRSRRPSTVSAGPELVARLKELCGEGAISVEKARDG
jgi:hypothetical protein